MNELPSSITSGVSELGVDASQASLAERWYVLIMMCLVYTMSIADRYVVSTVLDPIRLELHLTDSGVAMLTGLAFGLFYVILGFPLSYLIDRYNRRKIIAVCLVLWSAMTAVCGLARNSFEFFLARVGVTVGEAGGTPGANSLLSDYFPASRRAMALTVFSLGAPFGAYVGYNVAGIIADHYGWRMVFYALGLPGVLAGIAVWFTIREPRRGCLDNGDDQTPTVVDTLRFLWSQRSAVHVMMGTAVCALWGWGLMFWTPTFLMRTYQLSVGQAAAVTENMHLWGGGIATLVTGWLMARSSMTDARRIVWLLAAGIGIATVASGVVYWTRDLAVAKAMLWIFIPAIYFYIGPGFGLLNNLAQCRMRAMFCAMVLFLANLGNLVIAPPLIGGLSDWFARHLQVSNADSLRLAMLCLVPTGLWATAHLFLSARDILKDQERARTYP